MWYRQLVASHVKKKKKTTKRTLNLQTLKISAAFMHLGTQNLKLSLSA